MLTSLTSVLYGNAAVLLVVCGGYAWWMNTRAALNRAMFIFCLLLALANSGQALQALAHDVGACAFWYHISWVGWSLYPAVVMLIAFMLTGREAFLRKGWPAIVLCLPAAFFCGYASLHLLGVQAFLPTATGTFLPRYSYTLPDLAYVVYQYSYDLIALCLIGWHGFTGKSRRHRRQAVVVVGSAVVAIGLDLCHYFLSQYPLTAMLGSVEHLIFAVALTYAITQLGFSAPTAALAANYILQHVKDCVLLTTMDGTIHMVNHVATLLTGSPAATLVGKPLTAVIHTLRPDATDCSWMHEPGPHVAQLLTAQETTVPIEVTCSPMTDSSGDPIGIVVIGSDVRPRLQLEREIAHRDTLTTELQQAHDALESLVERRTAELVLVNRALRESEEHYRGIVESIQDIYFRMSLTGIVLAVSPSVEVVTGYPPEKLIGRPIENLDLEQSRYAPYLEAVHSHGRVDDFEVCARHKNGALLTLAISAHLVVTDDGALQAIEGIIRDITARTASERALRHSEHMLVKAQQIANIGSWEWEMSTLEVVWSEQMYRITGYNRTQFSPTYANALAFVHPDDLEAALTASRLARDTRTPLALEHRIVTAQGQIRHVLTQADTIYDEHGTPVQMVGSMLDITERKLAEETIARYQQELRSLALEVNLAQEQERRRLAIELHDQISQPLVLSRMRVQALRKAMPEEKAARALQQISTQLEELIGLTSTLTFELSPPVLYELGLTAAIEWYAERLSTEYHLEISITSDPDLPPLPTELRMLLFRMLQELLMNVVKHAHATQAQVTLTMESDEVRAMVRDDGVGMVKTELREAHASGGFGLFSIQERARYCDGSLTIESAPGCGTCVTIRLPRRIDRLEVIS